MTKREEERDLAQKLRYYSAENLRRDFRLDSEQLAMEAVIKWLSFNAVIARRLKRPGHYRTNWRPGDDLASYDAVVLDRKDLDSLEKILGIAKAKAKANEERRVGQARVGRSR